MSKRTKEEQLERAFFWAIGIFIILFFAMLSHLWSGFGFGSLIGVGIIYWRIAMYTRNIYTGER